MKIFYITRTYAADLNSENCSGFRNYTVELLKKRYDVSVVTPDYTGKGIRNHGGIITIPYKVSRWDSYLERLGFYEDYLERWVKDAESYLLNVVKEDDVLIAVSGGEMGSIILAAKLKMKCGCKMIINFHDPVSATTINGKVTYRFHVNRDRVLGKYLAHADQIITCSKRYQEILEMKYKEIFPCIHNVYLGFRGKEEVIGRSGIHRPVRMVYAGTMSEIQDAGRFINLFAQRDGLEIIFVGNCSQKIKEEAGKNKNVKMVPSMPHDDYIDYIKSEADIGLVALKGDEFGACVPSKIYELINLEIPIFGILPDGDAKEIINSGYGFACTGNNINEANALLDRLLQPEEYEMVRNKMREDKAGWQMDRLFVEIYHMIDSLVGGGCCGSN